MTIMTQKEAVYRIIMMLVKDNGILFEPGSASLKELLPEELKQQAAAELFSGFKSGVVNIARKKEDPELKSYCMSVINNWLDRDPRLYTDSIKQSNQNKSIPKDILEDSVVKSLKALLKTKTKAQEIREIQKFIDQRIADLAMKE